MTSSGSSVQLKDYFSKVLFNKYFPLFGVALISILNLFMRLLNAWPSTWLGVPQAGRSFSAFFFLLAVLNLHFPTSFRDRNIDETFPITVFPTLF